MAVLESQADIEALNPDLSLVKRLPACGLIVTAKGDQADFVSRCFFPQSGIDEDPVTGSAHVVMVPYWARQTGKNKLSAIQLSARRGYLDCELAGDRVLVSGQAHTYLVGDFFI
jgi:predicted PhzF superfamily epimerase YddE/YHI9